MTIEEMVHKILSDSRMHAAVAQIVGDMLNNVAAPAPEQDVDAENVMPAKEVAVSAEKPAPARKGRKIDWSKITKDSAYKLYYYRIKHNQEIEPELHDALMRFYADAYNPETHLIEKKYRKAAVASVVSVAAVAPELPRPLKDLPHNTIMARYHLAIVKGEPIDDDLHAELVARGIRGYDAASRLIVTKERKPRKRKPYKECSTAYLRNLYYSYPNKADMPDELHHALIGRLPGYVAQTREMVKLKPGERFVSATEIAEMNGKKRRKKQRHAPKAEQKGYIATASEIEALEKDAQSLFDDAASAPVAAAVPKPAKPAPVMSVSYPTTELYVTIKPVTSDGVYNDVFVNGECILHKHRDTELRTFLDGTILGIRGIMPTDSELRSRPQWFMFNTNLQQSGAAAKGSRYMGRPVYIKAVYEMPAKNELRIDRNNNSITILDLMREKRRAMGRIFKIMDDKTK